MANPRELKQLQVQLAKAEAEHEAAREEMKQVQRKQALAVTRCKELREKIAPLGEKGIIVTEHALLRYFERVLGYNLEAIETGLITPEVRAVAKEFRNGVVPSVGCRLVFKEGVVVTLEV